MENQINVQELSTEQLEQLLKEKKKKEQQLKKQKVQAYELARHEYVAEVVNAFKRVNEELTNIKTMCLEKGVDLYEMMFDVYGKEQKDCNSFQLESNDGLKKVIIEFNERVEFDERATVHINTIKQIFRDKFAQRNQKMYNMLETLLVKNKGGDYDPRLLTKLNKHREDVDDPKFNDALDELAKCHRVTGTGKYVRAYERNDLDDKWENISVQFSTL